MKKIAIWASALGLAAMISGCSTLSNLASVAASSADTTTGTTATSSSSSTSTSATGILGSILGALGATTNSNTIIGTWTYQEPAVQFSSDNLLAKAGGSVASAKVVEKIKPYFEKVGIKEGKMILTLNEDNTCTYTLKNKTYEGTYTYDSSNDQITIKTTSMSFPTAYVSVSGNQLSLTFDSTKILNLVQSAGSLAGSSSTLSTISQIATAYDGMKTGFLFTK